MIKSGFSFEAGSRTFRLVLYHLTSRTINFKISGLVFFFLFLFVGLGYPRKPWAEETQDNRAINPSN